MNVVYIHANVHTYMCRSVVCDSPSNKQNTFICICTFIFLHVLCTYINIKTTCCILYTYTYVYICMNTSTAIGIGIKADDSGETMQPKERWPRRISSFVIS